MYLKKIVYFMLVGVMTLGIFSGCMGKASRSKEISEPIRIAALNGPTGMGVARLMEDEADKYTVTLYQNPDEVVGKIVSGEVDIACIPSNLAAVLYNKTQKGISLLGTNTLGVLYIVENGESIKSLEDLKDKKIVMSGKGATPEFILNTMLTSVGLDSAKDVTVEFMANHTDVVSKLVTEEGTIALLPEPHVSIAEAKGTTIKVAIDINAAWQESQKTDLPMGVIIANNTFIKEKESDLEVFLESYKKSVDFVNTNVDEAASLMVKHGILPNEAVAKESIPKCNIIFKDGEESKNSLNTFYGIISKIDPKSVGGSMPDEAFYYSR